MSVARLEPVGRRVPGAPPPEVAGRPARGPVGGWGAFTALAFYGTLRWGTMLDGRALGVLLLELGAGVLVAAVARRLGPGRSGRLGSAALGLLGLGSMLVLAGYPVRWLTGPHLGRLGAALTSGLNHLSGLIVPYTGGPGPTRSILLLGAGGCLLLAGLAFGSVREPRRPSGAARLGVAAAALAALGVIPSAIATPQLPYLHALVTAGLTLALVLGPRLSPARRGAGIALASLAVLAASIALGTTAGTGVLFRPGHARGGASTAGPTDSVGPATFSWTQTYGAQGWPHAGTLVLSIAAPRPGLWKTEDLDSFSAGRWEVGASGGAAAPGRTVSALAGVNRTILDRYRETISVIVLGLDSELVIAAGTAAMPSIVGAIPGSDDGTWQVPDGLTPGDSYRVEVYDPTPSLPTLIADRAPVPRALAPFRAVGDLGPAYAGVRRLAASLAGRAGPSPARRVLETVAYLDRHETYTLRPPAGGIAPLATFLGSTHRGYCQQFAGAAALLLRLQGVPVRVATGFSVGLRSGSGGAFLVKDTDAHAWIEVWFAGYGWVPVDPTPPRAAGAAAPGASAGLAVGALGGTGSDSGNLAATLARQRSGRRPGSAVASSRQPTGAGARRRTSGGGTGPSFLGWLLIGVGAGGLIGIGIAAAWARRLRRAAPERLGPGAASLVELERAFRRCGRALEPAETLGQLAERLSSQPAAAAYVRAIEADRYGRGGGAAAPDRRGRAELRRWLAAPAGRLGRLRAWMALPPRATLPRDRPGH